MPDGQVLARHQVSVDTNIIEASICLETAQ